MYIYVIIFFFQGGFDTTFKSFFFPFNVQKRKYILLYEILKLTSL